MRYPVLAALLLAAATASAQTTRAVQPTEYWPELQGELTFKNGDYLLLALRGERSNYDGYTNRTLGFDTRRVALTYEHFWNPHWSWGAIARYESDARYETNSYGDLLVPELLLRHRSPIFGGLTFGQRLSAERQILVNRHLVGGSGADGQFWGRLRVDVERLFPLGGDAAGGFALRPRLSYLASTHLRFQKDDTDPTERTIQFTSLRAEVGLRLSPAFDVTPWFAYQTSYGYSLPQYDKNGIQVRGGNYNDVVPTLGLDLRYTITLRGAQAAHQQLPTQH